MASGGHIAVIDNNNRTAQFVDVVDGDTFTAMLALVPARVKPQPMLKARIRVADWNAAELREAEGPAMRDAFERILRSAILITVTLRYMSFERIVSDVYINGERFDGLLKTELMRLRASNAEHSEPS